MSAPDTHVRQPSLKGRRPVAGLWLPADWLAVEVRAALLLRHWRAGSAAWRFPEGDLLRFNATVVQDCDALEGWPLLALETGGLCSAELTQEEQATLPAADLWLVQGGRVTALDLHQAERLALEDCLDLDGHPWQDTHDCRDALPPLVIEELPPAKDIHTILQGKVKPPSPQRDAFLQSLAKNPPARTSGKQAPAQATSGGAGKGTPIWPWVFAVVILGRFLPDALHLPQGAGPASASTAPLTEAAGDPSGPGPLLFVAVLLVVIALLLIGALRRFFSGTPQHWTAAPTPVASARALPPRRSQAPATPSRWRRLLTSLAITSRFSALLNRRQSAYLRRMLNLFEKGDIDEALRHALPLGGEQGSLGQAFGTPDRRDDLSLGRPSGPGASISLGEDLEAHLRKVYRQHFEKLDRAGRIDEAVFILAELLKVRQEALDYLERHQRFRQAAELALAWDMSTDWIVRLFCLADDWKTALQVARRDDAFVSAVQMLQTKWPQVADRLRMEWAEMLVARGDWLKAVDVAWPIPEARDRAVQWLSQAEAAGGSLGTEALVTRAALLPDTLEAYAAPLRALRDDPARFRDRQALARALLWVGTKNRHTRDNRSLALLARMVLPALLDDHATQRAHLSRSELDSLLKLSRDTLLQADLPSRGFPKVRATPLQRATSPLHWQAPPAGQQAILDAVALEDQRTLVALGEAGAQVLDAHGRAVFSFAEPAHRLVIAHNRRVALAMARRDQVWRITKLDLVRRTARNLGVLELHAHSPVFDGISWAVTLRDSVRVVDVDRSFAVLWHVSDLKGDIRLFHHTEHFEQWLVSGADSTHMLWRYALPSRRLVERIPVAPPLEHQRIRPNPVGGLLTFTCRDDAQGGVTLTIERAGRRCDIPLPGTTPVAALDLEVFPEWLLVGLVPQGNTRQWRLVSQQSLLACAVLDWPADAPLQVRAQAHDWRLFDQTGRLLRLDTLTSELRELRG
ncbi:bpX6 domain-containing protein [Metapseudomonas otitidis]|uniref:bpX6 domain-containing protein n=1 Tax=Metapseudomonas otitidis TaxID=319939 RepID=UPI00321629CA